MKCLTNVPVRKVGRLFMVMFMLLTSTSVMTQTYKGSMTVGEYKQENVEVVLSANSHGDVSMLMRRVKFARMMPVKINLNVAPLSRNGTMLTANDIMPVYKNKTYDKYIIRTLKGRVGGKHLSFDCMMGDKKLHYEGVVVSAK